MQKKNKSKTKIKYNNLNYKNIKKIKNLLKK